MQSTHGNCHWLVLLTLEGDWALRQDPICVSQSEVTSPFPPSWMQVTFVTETFYAFIVNYGLDWISPCQHIPF